MPILPYTQSRFKRDFPYIFFKKVLIFLANLCYNPSFTVNKERKSTAASSSKAYALFLCSFFCYALSDVF